jgi:hypothetical protein
MREMRYYPIFVRIAHPAESASNGNELMRLMLMPMPDARLPRARQMGGRCTTFAQLHVQPRPENLRDVWAATMRYC